MQIPGLIDDGYYSVTERDGLEDIEKFINNTVNYFKTNNNATTKNKKK